MYAGFLSRYTLQTLSASGRRYLSVCLMLASGFAGLGYQIIWTQQSALWLGHDSAAVLAVVAAFFGGLALGALAMGPKIARSKQAVRWYALCEALIALWGLLLIVLMRPVSDWLLSITGVQPSPLWQWLVAFSGTFFVLLPATAAMGATLPAMQRLSAEIRAQGRSIAVLYAANTLGAVIGVLATAFWLIPELGLLYTTLVCAGLNLLCACAALVALPRKVALASSQRPQATLSQPDELMRLVLTGLLGIGYEVLVIRVLSQVAEDTVYTFAILLAVYLLGTALGAAIYQRWFADAANPEKLSDKLLSGLALACMSGTLSLWLSEPFKRLLLASFNINMVTAIGIEAMLALAAFALPTMVMGALFSHLCAGANAAGISFGRALGVNTLGAAVAPPLFGVLIAPWLGPKLALLLVAMGYLALTSSRAWRTSSVWLPAVMVLALAVWAPPLAFVDIPEGGKLVSYKEGVMAAVSVVEDANGVARLRINNRQQEGSSSSLLVDGRQALLPLLLHPAPQQVLFLGLGTGVTASSAAQEAALQVDAVELLPEVIQASGYFRQVFAGGNPKPQLHLMQADARRYVKSTAQSYDVIVSDNFHPARSGSGSLYTVEHFQDVRTRLRLGGLFCQWLPLHQLDLETLRSIVQAFIAVYPGGWGILASNSLETPVLGLVGQAVNSNFNVQQVGKRLHTIVLAKSPAAFGIEDEFALLGSFVAGPNALARFAGSAAANTDDHPVVAYHAPRITYAPESLPRERLTGLIQALAIEPSEIIDSSTNTAWKQRLAAYWLARNRYIEVGRNVRPSANVTDMLAQVREPLLSVLRISPDFRPAYDPLLRMAAALARTDAYAARALLTELAQIQPARPEAISALQQLTLSAP